MTLHRAMSLVAMAFLWTSSQIPVYLFGKSIFETSRDNFIAMRPW